MVYWKKYLAILELKSIPEVYTPENSINEPVQISLQQDSEESGLALLSTGPCAFIQKIIKKAFQLSYPSTSSMLLRFFCDFRY